MGCFFVLFRCTPDKRIGNMNMVNAIIVHGCKINPQPEDSGAFAAYTLASMPGIGPAAYPWLYQPEHKPAQKKDDGGSSQQIEE